MDERPNPATPFHLRRMRRWGAVAGSLAVVGGLGGTAATASTTEAQPVPAAFSSATTEESTEATTEVATVAAPDLPPVTAEQVADAQAPTETVTPEGYSPEQYEAFWGAGYTSGDALALAELWATDEISAKAKAGQALLEGRPVPLEPGTVADGPVEDADPLWTAFADSGYTYDDAVALSELWATGVDDAKARVGRAVLDGEDLPIAPGSSVLAAG